MGHEGFKKAAPAKQMFNINLKVYYTTANHINLVEDLEESSESDTFGSTGLLVPHHALWWLPLAPATLLYPLV